MKHYGDGCIITNLTMQVHTEAEAYPLVSFISDIGGTSSMWLGCSVISYTEFVSLFAVLLIFCCKREKVYEGQVDPYQTDVTPRPGYDYGPPTQYSTPPKSF